MLLQQKPFNTCKGQKRPLEFKHRYSGKALVKSKKKLPFLPCTLTGGFSKLVLI
jgi:hypothetical protein